VDTCRINELEATVDQLRRTIKLIIGRENSIPWTEVPDAEVDGFVAEVERLEE
jgi:hypothetical protein